MRTASVAIAIVAAALAACGTDDDGTVADVTETSGGGEPATPPPSSAPATSSTLPASTIPDTTSTSAVPPTTEATPGSSVPSSRAAEQAIADLVERRGVDPSAVATVSVDEVTWRDASLGCPRKGMQYAQVLTDGIRIVLEVDGKRYEYHAGRGRAPFYCPRPEPPAGET